MSRCSFLRAGQLPEVRLAGPGEPHAAVLHTDVGAGGRGARGEGPLLRAGDAKRDGHASGLRTRGRAHREGARHGAGGCCREAMVWVGCEGQGERGSGTGMRIAIAGETQVCVTLQKLAASRHERGGRARRSVHAWLVCVCGWVGECARNKYCRVLGRQGPLHDAQRDMYGHGRIYGPGRQRPGGVRIEKVCVAYFFWLDYISYISG